MFRQALRDAVNGEEMTGLRFDGKPLLIQEFPGCRHVQRLEIAASEAQALEDIIKGVWPFMIAELIVLFAMVLFPGLVTIPAKWFGG